MTGRIVGEQSKGAVGLELCHHVFVINRGRPADGAVGRRCRGSHRSEVLKKVPSSGSFEEAPESREVTEARVRCWSLGTEVGEVALEHCPGDIEASPHRRPVSRKRANQVSPVTSRRIAPKEIPRRGETSPRTSPPRVTMPGECGERDRVVTTVTGMPRRRASHVSRAYSASTPRSHDVFDLAPCIAQEPDGRSFCRLVRRRERG